ncbi:MAG: hypothetical protein B6244_04720 [Candidatus Cloacimonetes bacterium 4572_55]|nr:MAG: hypothetical protein B6244_04720 [Candidatus Cloacimonetes bacterium 4572_55]
MKYSICLIFFFFLITLACADTTWTPFQFQVGDNFRYEIIRQTDDKEKKLGFFDFQVTQKEESRLKFKWQIEEGDLTKSNSFYSTINQLSGKILVDMMVNGSELSELIAQSLFAPTLELQYRNLSIEEGESRSRRGGSSKLTVGKAIKIAGIDGLTVSYYEKDELIFEHVIDKSTPLPLSIKTKDKEGRIVVWRLTEQ